jgi:hypothetical protein
MRFMRFNSSRLLLVISMLLLFSSAQSVYSRTVDEKVVAADFVFEGVVVDVQTRFSKRDSDSDPKIPYRFVTYSIANILKGNYNQALVTLRFLGGESEDGNVLMIPGQPLFDVGDHDLLMVKANNVYPCPLVDCAQGRFRYLGGMVVNELGLRIYLDQNGHIVKGEVIENDELTTNQLSENVTIKRQELSEVDASEIPNIAEDYPEATTADPDSFTNNVDEKIQATHTQEQLTNLPPFQSSDTEAEFVDPTYQTNNAMQASPPELRGEDQDAQMSEDERIERELEQAMQAQSQQNYDSPEYQQALAQLNRKMEKAHPGFYAGDEDSGLIASANAGPHATGQTGGGESPSHTSSAFVLWSILGGIMLMVLAAIWIRRRYA